MRKITRRRRSNLFLAAVILAAGQGSRLRSSNGGVPKPLTPLFGGTLLERAILCSVEVGATQCFVITGCDHEQVVAHLGQVVPRKGTKIQPIHNPRWKEGNGTSVLAAAPYLTGAHLLLMSDVVFDPDIARCLLDADHSSRMCLAAVDKNIEQVFDMEDATKVQVENGKITALGKEITSFNAVLTGLLLCRPILFDALRKAGRSGDGSLDGGLRELAAAGMLAGVDIGERFWIDIDTGKALDQAYHILETS